MKTISSITAICLTVLLPSLLMAKPPHKARTPSAAAASATPSGPLISGSTETPGVPNPPDVYAHAYILVDYTSGQVLAQHDADAHVEPASLTKLMTCYAV